MAGSGVYRWNETYDSGQTNWRIGDSSATSTDGATWSAVTSVAMKFNVSTGAAIPEPSTCVAFAGFGALAFALWRRRSEIDSFRGR